MVEYGRECNVLVEMGKERLASPSPSATLCCRRFAAGFKGQTRGTLFSPLFFHPPHRTANKQAVAHSGYRFPPSPGVGTSNSGIRNCPSGSPDRAASCQSLWACWRLPSRSVARKAPTTIFEPGVGLKL